jgi:hypothetical protein
LFILLGIVQSITGDTATINFMKRSGQYFVWPAKRDTQTIPVVEILCVVSGTPAAVSKTRFKFESLEYIDNVLQDLLSD